MTRAFLGLVLGTALLAGLPVGTAHAQSVREEILYLNEDGRTYQNFRTLRARQSSQAIWLRDNGTMDNYLYFYPNNYRFDESDPDYNHIRISQGSYSHILDGEFGDRLEIADNGDFIFESARDQDPDDERYGAWYLPGGFKDYVYAWVLPANIEIVEAESNREGEWVQRRNVIAWFGSDVNNISFTIRYRFRTADTLAALREAVGAAEGIEIEQEGDGVRFTLADTILFPSGEATLTPEGGAVIAELARAIDFGAGLQAVVEGHTDDVPIAGALSATFPTNWELSAGRALAVVHAMEGAGVPGGQLEARAYGEHRPVADNGTPEGRAANRRISILISSPST